MDSLEHWPLVMQQVAPVQSTSSPQAKIIGEGQGTDRKRKGYAAAGKRARGKTPWTRNQVLTNQAYVGVSKWTTDDEHIKVSELYEQVGSTHV